ncbi:MAG: YraN family protein [Patescibacteria group bacterium]|nr:YraN family protein [Patescibacteria group bacterium]MDE2590421.1 YraN family protein [Patescibacteria group bacterium]
MKMKNPIGKQGENQAAHYLMQKGYRLVEMNFKKEYTKIDIIATKDNTAVFIEVTTRVSDEPGKSFEAITHTNIGNLVRVAKVYAKMHPDLPKAIRIDAIGVTMDKNGVVEDIEHVENISKL